MEPSTGVPGKDVKSLPQTARNFSWSVEDFILHYCLREYLCQDGETYHLTDLAKGGMTIRLAGEQRQARYDRWYPLIEKELRLLTKQGGTRLRPIKGGTSLRKIGPCVASQTPRPSHTWMRCGLSTTCLMQGFYRRLRSWLCLKQCGTIQDVRFPELTLLFVYGGWVSESWWARMILWGLSNRLSEAPMAGDNRAGPCATIEVA